MIESSNNPELVPYFVSFEGKVPADKVSEIVSFLGAMSTEVDVKFRAGALETTEAREDEVPDFPLGMNDIFRVAEAHEISKVLAGKTVGVLKRLAYPSQWGERILLPNGGYSSRALKEAILRGDLEAVSGMGPKSCELVRLAIADVEARLSSAGDED